MSYGASRQSKCVEADSAAIASAGPEANRPPHSWTGGVDGQAWWCRSRFAAIFDGRPHSCTKPLASDWSNVSPSS